MNRLQYTHFIGIDTGTHTGFAVWEKPKHQLIEVATLSIHRAMDAVKQYHALHEGKVFVRFEDARLRKWLSNKTTAELQGAGSIKRDCTIWEDFLRDNAIPFASIAPRKGLTKWESIAFQQATGWLQQTSHHARDAALLVFGM